MPRQKLHGLVAVVSCSDMTVSRRALALRLRARQEDENVSLNLPVRQASVLIPRRRAAER